MSSLSPTTSPRVSPPIASPAPSSSDESFIPELSFDYEYNSQGELVRVSKGSTKSPHSTPPSPPDLERANLSKPILTNGQSQHSAPRRSSLSRSDSMPAETQLSARPLQRTVSGPITTTVTPALSSRSLGSLASGLGTGRRLGGAQRITMQEAERQRRETEERIQREGVEKERERLRREIEKEKENKGEPRSRHSPTSVHARPIAALPARQFLPGFSKTAKASVGNKLKPSVAKVIKLEGEESEQDDENVEGQNVPPLSSQRQYLQLQSQLNRMHINPTEAPPELHVDQVPDQFDGIGTKLQARHPSYPPRTSASVGSVNRARRITLEERMRQDQEIVQEALERVKEEENVEDENLAFGIEHYPSSSPTHVAAPRVQSLPAPPRVGYTHQRRDSDTLRNGLPPNLVIPQGPRENGDPVSARSSPPGRNGTSTLVQSSRHRRSPTAPEHPTASATLAQNIVRDGIGKTWAPGENDGYERDRDRLMEEFGDNPMKMLSNPQMQQQQQLVSLPLPDSKTRNLVVNRKYYARLDLIGKGGSSRVYRVMNSANEIYALKRVSLDKTDTESLRGYMNEISLLKRLAGNNRIIRLIDSEAKGGPIGGHLMLVMECGEVDLAKLLQEQQKEPLNMVWVAYYWQQILEAVQVIHEEKIVHSDLKPANFVLVKGNLKLIDFGIANAIANDTTNIQRDHQIGTLNYMSPEAIELPDGMRRLKVGRPSDVWSLGCILYQMVYGQPPFHHLSAFQKMKAIPDSSHVIEFPDYAVPTRQAPRSPLGGPSSPPEKLTELAKPVRQDVKATMQKCLQRSPKDRSTIPELLEEDWLAGKEPFKLKDDETVINAFYMKQLLQYAIRCAREGGGTVTDSAQDAEAKRLVQELKSISALVASQS